MTMIFNQKE